MFFSLQFIAHPGFCLPSFWSLKDELRKWWHWDKPFLQVPFSSWLWGPCVMWKAFCICGTWCTAPFSGKSNCPLVFHLYTCSRREGEPGRHKLPLVKNRCCNLAACNLYQDPTGPSGWHGWTWPMKQVCLESCCDVWLSKKPCSVDRGFCGELGFH